MNQVTDVLCVDCINVEVCILPRSGALSVVLVVQTFVTIVGH